MLHIDLIVDEKGFIGFTKVYFYVLSVNIKKP